MICISFRSPRNRRLSSVVTFSFWNHTSPEVGSINRRIVRPVVDLPQPDSPTRPSVSPGWISKVTSSTACTRATSRESRPPRIGKYFFRLRTRRSGSGMGGPLIEEAGHLVARSYFFEWRRVLEVHGLGQPAAWREPAPRLGRATQRGHDARDRLQALPLGGGQIDTWDRAQQPLGVGVQRLLE